MAIDDLAPAGAAQRLDALFQFLLAGGEGSAPDQLGGDEFALLGFDEEEMPAVVRQIARVGRLVTARHLDIAGDLGGDLLRHGRGVLPSLHVQIGRPMQQHGGARPGLRHRARAVGRLAVGQHAAAGPGSGIEVAERCGRLPSSSAACLRARPWRPEHRR